MANSQSGLQGIPPNEDVVAAFESLRRGKSSAQKKRQFETALQAQMEQYQFKPPFEPDEDTVVGRILSPEKFIHFLAKPGLYLSPPRDYEDPCVGSFPSGVLRAHKQGLDDNISQACLAVSVDDLFRNDVHSMFVNAATSIKFPPGTASCWTIVEPFGASELMWRTYTGGRNGVGIKTSYRTLKSIFRYLLDEADRQEYLISGLVEYTENELRRHPAFRKRSQFSPEKEVRFFAPEVREARVFALCFESHGAFETFYSSDIDGNFKRHTEDLIKSQSPEFFCSRLRSRP